MRFSTRSAQRVRNNHTVMPSTSLSDGIVPNRVFHSTELLSFATVVDRRQRMIPAFRNVSFLCQETQKTAENHQPHPLALPMVKPFELPRQEAHEVIEL
jgi:hypothetical protein